ncbi:AraC family transcriptional regulator [uncultured Pseudoteredinibacter sp.]|uniref:AraC family transcriptional regulator n=1 Tax=uncultured Pseudoteredinibacter sp. TaxID=1641701 RepID=UPI00262C7BB6|nr:AraC family transcriptional regulator [uncultured Pseudoteredinibacter sp.]
MRHSHINSLWIKGILASFEQLGLPMAKLLDGLYSKNLLPEDQLGALELGAARTLWHRAEKLTNMQSLGVHIGMLQSVRASGVLMPICLHSPTPLKAFEHIAKFQGLISDNGIYRIRTEAQEGLISCDYIPSAHSVPSNRQQLLSILTGTVMLLRAISPEDPVLAIEVQNDLALDDIAELLQLSVQPAGEYPSIKLSMEKMQVAIEGRDEHLYEINLAYAEGMVRAKLESQSIREQVKQLIEQKAPAEVNLEQVAERLGVHKRVLQRSLAEQGSSFRQLKEGLLKETALKLLVTERQEISMIAQELGYSEVSAFQRAFKSWFGVSPKRFRDAAVT